MENGLTQKEAEKRLWQYGANEISRKRKVTDLNLLIDQFKFLLIYVLVAAMGVTGLILKDWEDTVMIGAAVSFNTILGFFQERKANRSLEALASVLTPEAVVKRDGEWTKLPASQVVPGDVARLELGRKIPADGVVIHDGSLIVDESVLTGESVGVTKKVEEPVYMGTTVAAGIGEMLVDQTGQKTKFGEIAASLQITAKEQTPLQKQLNRFAKTMALVVLVISLLVIGIGLAVGDSFTELFPVAVALAVAAIPEGLAVSLTVILVIGMQRILKRKALVRKMLAAETLGGVTVICADKTGTVTFGKMRVVKALTVDEPMLRKAAAWCNDMRDPLEVAMMDWSQTKPSSNRLDEIPFDPKHKYIATLHPGLLFVSGAPEKLLEFCPQAQAQQLKNQFITEAKKAHRLVGFAYKKFSGKKVGREDVKDLTWLGTLVYEDPVRPGVAEVIKKFKAAGIKIKMITGDYKKTAEAVAKKVGIAKSDVYSRVTPDQKLDIVQKLQAEGEVVAMTGDGVNDAPALKKADIGIVVNEASDVSKETADMVLLNNDFEVILEAIRGGRIIQDNLQKVILYLLADSFGEIAVVVLSVIAVVPLPVTGTMILWINLISDGFPSLALTVEEEETGIMSRRPRRLRHLLNQEMVLLIALITLASGLTAFGAFLFYHQQIGYGLVHARTVAFALLGLNSLVYVWSVRSLSKPIWRSRWWQNPWLVGAVVLGLGLQLIGIYSPLGQRLLNTVSLNPGEWLTVILGSLVMLTVVEGVKWGYNKKT